MAVVQGAPLLLCNSASVSTADMVACDTVSTTYFGESLLLKRSASHRWIRFRDQTCHEALLFVSYDSHPLGGEAREFPYCFLGFFYYPGFD